MRKITFAIILAAILTLIFESVQIFLSNPTLGLDPQDTHAIAVAMETSEWHQAAAMFIFLPLAFILTLYLIWQYRKLKLNSYLSK